MNNIEQKLLEYLISLLHLKKPSRQIKVKKLDIIHFLFSETRNKKSTEFTPYYYSRLQKAYENIGRSGVIIKFDNNKGEIVIPLCLFLDHKDINYIVVEFTDRVLPFLCFLEGNFTKYKIGYIYKLKGNYSICLYKYFCMKYNIREKNNKIVSWQENLKDLRFILDIKNQYKNFSDLKKRVFNPSIKEINKNTDLEIDYKTVCGGPNGRKILAIEFTAKKKYKETAIEKSKNKAQFSKEIFSNKQNSIKEEKTIPAAIYTEESANTRKTVKEVEVAKITNTKPTRKTSINIEEKDEKNGNIQGGNGSIHSNIDNSENYIDNMDFQKIEKEKVSEKKTPFFKKVKKCFSACKDIYKGM